MQHDRERDCKQETRPRRGISLAMRRLVTTIRCESIPSSAFHSTLPKLLYSALGSGGFRAGYPAKGAKDPCLSDHPEAVYQGASRELWSRILGSKRVKHVDFGGLATQADAESSFELVSIEDYRRLLRAARHFQGEKRKLQAELDDWRARPLRSWLSWRWGR